MRRWLPILLLLVLVQPVPGNLYQQNLRYTNSTNEITSLGQLGGQYILLDAMATWCAPCRIEMLHLADVYDVIKGEPDVKMISMSMDPEEDTIPKLEDFMAEFDANWDFALDHTANIREYLNITGYPTTLFISPEGEVIKTWLGLTDADVILTAMDQYLDLPGSLARRLGVSDLLSTLIGSPFFILFMIMLWIFIFLSIGRLIKKVKA